MCQGNVSEYGPSTTLRESSANVFLAAELGIDDLPVQRHRAIFAALGHRRPVEIDSSSRAHFQEGLESDQDHADVVELTENGENIGHEVER